MNSDLAVGSQFATDAQNSTINDTYCRDKTTGPRLTFQAHMAPDDIKFNNSGDEAWVTFRGSWNRKDPVGYKLSVWSPSAFSLCVCRSSNFLPTIFHLQLVFFT